MPGPREITTNRLTLRPPVAGDRSLWVRLHRDPALYEHTPWAMPTSDDEASRGFDDCLTRWTEGGFDYGVVEEASARAGIGVGGLRRRDLEGEDVLNLYYRLEHDAHGRGLGREAARGWVAHALEWLPDLPVVARARGVDEASVRAAVAAGLEPAGTVVEGPADQGPSTLLRAPRFTAHDWFDEETRERVVDLWMAVNDSGGAVGFLPGAPRADVTQTLAVHEEGMADGTTTAVLLRWPDSRVVAAGFWVADRNPLLGHTRTAYRVMTDPGLRGRNLGRLLMAAMHRVARDQGVEVAVLDVRSGLGTTRFYEVCGYVEVGRVPGVIRVAPGDDRDSVIMARRLDGRPMVADDRA
ncbi:GNAT family N-acetyltransferase [Oryzobacter telluris]|uniref:GNAT family N-acetyltransferase n=1 Tax=Oryzobacter telluris TaxID=3149179 RepID=UPI00370D2CE5